MTRLRIQNQFRSGVTFFIREELEICGEWELPGDNSGDIYPSCSSCAVASRMVLLGSDRLDSGGLRPALWSSLVDLGPSDKQAAFPKHIQAHWMRQSHLRPGVDISMLISELHCPLQAGGTIVEVSIMKTIFSMKNKRN